MTGEWMRESFSGREEEEVDEGEFRGRVEEEVDEGDF